MCGGEPFLVPCYFGFIPSFFHFFIIIPIPHSLSFYHFVYDFKEIIVCEVGEEGCICVKKKYNGFWFKVVSCLFFYVLLRFLGYKNNSFNLM
jgi:hypothetical protein